MKPNNLTLLGLLIGLLISAQAHAQRRVEEKSFNVLTNQKVKLDLKFGDHIIVKAWDKKEVSFKAVIEINGGKLNDALLLSYADKDPKELRIGADFDKERIKAGKCGDCSGNSTFSWNNHGNGYVICSHITYEIYVPRSADVDVESISSDIELAGLDGPVYAKTISGFVDLSWSERRGADISMKTISGEAYSDLDNLGFRNKKDTPPIVGYELLGTVGRGGPNLHLESISGNIYLRKEKI